MEKALEALKYGHYGERDEKVGRPVDDIVYASVYKSEQKSKGNFECYYGGKNPAKAEHTCKVVLWTKGCGVLDLRTNMISAAEKLLGEILIFEAGETL